MIENLINLVYIVNQGMKLGHLINDSFMLLLTGFRFGHEKGHKGLDTNFSGKPLLLCAIECTSRRLIPTSIEFAIDKHCKNLLN